MRGGSPTARSPTGAWTPTRPGWHACWSPRWPPTWCCTRWPRRGPGMSYWPIPTPSRWLLSARAAVTRVPTPAAAAPLGALGAFSDDWTAAPFADDPPAQPGREFTLRLRRGRSNIWAEVFDPDLRLPRIRAAGENDEGGRGLYLVDQLASRWGSRPTSDGKAVWFELPLQESGPGG